MEKEKRQEQNTESPPPAIPADDHKEKLRKNTREALDRLEQKDPRPVTDTDRAMGKTSP